MAPSELSADLSQGSQQPVWTGTEPHRPRTPHHAQNFQIGVDHALIAIGSLPMHIDSSSAEPLRLLAGRYWQYREAPPTGPVLAVRVERWSGWAAAAHRA